MLIDQINHLELFQYFAGLIIWFFLLFLLDQYLISVSNIDIRRKRNLLAYYTLLSIIAIFRIYTNILPSTVDSKVYLSVAESIGKRNEFFYFGAFLYSSFIYLIKEITFNNHYAILFLNNFIFIIALVDLFNIVPDDKKKSIWLWSLFLFLYPSIYWFIPNV